MENVEKAAIFTEKRKWLGILGFALLIALVYYLSNPNPQFHFDYTYRFAVNFFHGKIGYLDYRLPWLNELIPAGTTGRYYTAFPYGAIVSMIPFAALEYFGLIKAMPAAFIAATLAGISAVFLLLIAGKYDISEFRKFLLASAVLLGSFMWTNLVMAGAWHLALGFAMVGELGAIYFSVYNRKPLIAGAFFALAFGNRTEILLLAPVLMFLLTGNSRDSNTGMTESEGVSFGSRIAKVLSWETAWFCVVPFLLGVSTLFYNYIRFKSISDFGYLHIPGVLAEPWYRYGIFSLSYIPSNIYEMLLRPWVIRSVAPFVLPNPFGASILISSVWLLLLFRKRKTDFLLTSACWVSIAVLTFILWIHGNAGGYQFSYRYATILLPWIFVILLEKSGERISRFEWISIAVSIIINGYATWLFFFTDYMKA
ncbi:MAG: hypothetical protein R2684_17075 [Pyrinomonadaceae bacterium]